MTKQSFPFFLILLLSFCGTSCNDDDNMDIYYSNSNSIGYDCVSGSQEFYNDGENIFSYTCEEELVEFFFDIIGDETDEVGGSWPDLDLYRIYVDFNNNGTIDPQIDIMLSPKDDEICVVKLLTQSSTTACNYFSDVKGESHFSATENSTEMHYNAKITIPKYRLSDSSTASIIIKIHDPEIGWQDFPSELKLFSDVFELEL